MNEGVGKRKEGFSVWPRMCVCVDVLYESDNAQRPRSMGEASIYQFPRDAIYSCV